jgi:DNA-binding CsgD family transcriptional regulator
VGETMDKPPIHCKSENPFLLEKPKLDAFGIFLPLQGMRLMNYLNKLSKGDLRALLDIAGEACTARNVKQYQSCFQKMSDLILFDAAVSIYVDKEAVDNHEFPGYSFCPLNFSEKFLIRYINNQYYYDSPVFQSTYKTWELQSWKTVWSEGIYGNGMDSMRLAQSYGYMDGWSFAFHHRNNQTFSFFAYAGRKVDYDIRTQLILRYVTPHFAETQKAISHADLARQRELNKFVLTKREAEVLKWFESGKTAWEISVILGLSQSVIKWHSNNILRKLNAINRTHAVAIALRKGLLE